ncbi:hypothetical protein KM043_012923 [Ampulex compressa]|nr:hypothetical protein KM043_012923 [Ampulex compressa]
MAGRVPSVVVDMRRGVSHTAGPVVYFPGYVGPRCPGRTASTLYASLRPSVPTRSLVLSSASSRIPPASYVTGERATGQEESPQGSTSSGSRVRRAARVILLRQEGREKGELLYQNERNRRSTLEQGPAGPLHEK